MALDPTEFYAFARDINEGAGHHEEAKIRSVISRAYYAAFLSARNNAGIKDKSPAVHQRTADFYLAKGNSAIGNRLNDLRTSRNDADYDCDITVVKRHSGRALLLASQIMTDIGIKV